MGTRLLLALWAVALTGTLGLANTARGSGVDLRQPREPIAFGRIDSDHNGYVSRVEARSVVGVESRFDMADRNKDGLLDREEYLSLRQRQPLPR